jgi:hypothetical protein
MGRAVGDRQGNGNIVGQYAVQQYAGQEQLADNDPALLLISGRAATLAAIDAAANAVTGAGFAYNGATYQIDSLSQQNIAAWRSIALGIVANVQGLTWPAGFVWIAADNSQVPYATPAAFLAFAQPAANYVTALMLNARTLKDAVSAATTAQALAAIDPSKGLATADRYRADLSFGSSPGNNLKWRLSAIRGSS